MTNWTNTTKTGVTEVGEYVLIDEASSDILLVSNTDKLIINNSKHLIGLTTWTNQDK